MAGELNDLPERTYDGDALNLILTMDRYMTDLVEPLAPYHGVLDLNSPRKMSNNIEIPSPILETAANWIHEKRPMVHITPDMVPFSLTRN